MNVTELIDKYNESKKKDYDFAQHIMIHYLPYSEKLSVVKGIIDATCYVDVENKKYYKRDTPNMIFIFTMKLIEKYTDIEITPESVVSDYDALMESGVMRLLMEQIPKEEVSILQGMMDMMRDDLEVNTRSLVSFLETKTDALQMAFDSLNKVLERPDIQTKITEFTKK